MITYLHYEVDAVNAEAAVVEALALAFHADPDNRNVSFTSHAKLLGPGRFAVILSHEVE